MSSLPAVIMSQVFFFWRQGFPMSPRLSPTRSSASASQCFEQFFFFLALLGFELGASRLLGKLSTT
jgi:hypothetical protein